NESSHVGIRVGLAARDSFPHPAGRSNPPTPRGTDSYPDPRTMTNDNHATPLTHPLRWFPEFLEFGKRRFRAQGRVLGAAILVGGVAGLGGVVFTLAGQAVVRYALEGVAGYKAEGPAGEPHSAWIPDINPTLKPWLLLVVPTVGGLLSGFLVFRFAPEA